MKTIKCKCGKDILIDDSDFEHTPKEGWSDPEQAARRRDIAAIYHHGKFASLNFPKSDYQ